MLRSLFMLVATLGLAGSAFADDTLFSLSLREFQSLRHPGLGELRDHIQSIRVSECRSVNRGYAAWDGETLDPNQWSKTFTEGPVIYRTGDAAVGFAEHIFMKNNLPKPGTIVILQIFSGWGDLDEDLKYDWTTTYRWRSPGGFHLATRKAWAFGTGQDGKPIIMSFSKHQLWKGGEWVPFADEVTVCAEKTL